MSGGRGVCFPSAPTGMECLLLVLWREDPQVRLSMDESYLCPSPLQLLRQHCLRWSGHGLCRSGHLRTPALSQLPLSHP